MEIEKDLQISLIRESEAINTIPDDFTITAIARRDRIDLQANIPDSEDTVNNVIDKIEWEILIPLKSGESEDERVPEEYRSSYRALAYIESRGSQCSYLFDRTNIDRPDLCYPEISSEIDTEGVIQALGLEDYKVIALMTNSYGNTPIYEDGTHKWMKLETINTSGYGTWKFNFGRTNITATTTDRTAYIKLNTSKYSQLLDSYGTVKYRVSIKREGYVVDDTTGVDTTTSIADSQYYAAEFTKITTPEGSVTVGTSGGVYNGNEDNYKNTDATYTEVNGSFSHILPLYGQVMYKKDDEGLWQETGNKMQATQYTYNIVAVNEADECWLAHDSYHITKGAEITVTVTPTSIVDLVHSHSYYKNLYIENLSAINASVGVISQGGFGDIQNWNNFWILSDMSAVEAGISGTDAVKGGTFRVGDSNEYVTVIPPGGFVGEKGSSNYLYNDTKNYMVRIKAGNISLTTGGDTAFNSGTYVYNSQNPNKYRMKLSSNGIEMQICKNNDGLLWEAYGTVHCDDAGNMTITNDDGTNCPKLGTLISDTSARIFHLESNTDDQNGIDCESGTPPLHFSTSKEAPYIFTTSDVIGEKNSLYNGKLEFTSTELGEKKIVLFNKNPDLIINDVRYKLPYLTQVTNVSNLPAKWNSKLGVDIFKWGDR